MGVNRGMTTRSKPTVPDAHLPISTESLSDQEPVDHPFMPSRQVFLQLVEVVKPHTGSFPVSQRTGLTVSITSICLRVTLGALRT